MRFTQKLRQAVKSFGVSQPVVDHDGETRVLKAEITTDEFGGYCSKRWNFDEEVMAEPCSVTYQSVLKDLNIDQKAYELVREEFGLGDYDSYL